MQELDRDAVEWAASLDWPVVTPIMKALTVVGTWGAVWLAIGVVLALRRRDPRPAAIVGLTVLLASALGTLLKDVFDRPRPPVADTSIHALVTVPGSASMPSGHALTAFASAVVLGGLAPRGRAALLVLAAGIAVSRVYLGVHYVSDVLAGAAVGTMLGVAVLHLARRLGTPRGRVDMPPTGVQDT
jgi:undecaprenyl-diphosphatase